LVKVIIFKGKSKNLVGESEEIILL
jgi:hypothetical protein